MGEALMTIYRTRMKREYKLAFLSAFIMGLLVHLFKFTNVLPNHDTLYNFYSDQNMLGSGRWALQWACAFSGYYDLPWLNGMLAIVFLAVTAVVIVRLFKIQNPVVIVLTSAFLVTAIGTTETFLFEFTADGYFLAMLLAAVAVWCSRLNEKRIGMFVISAVCICLSCAIYQAYVSFALVLAVCYFIYEILQGECDKKQYWRWIVRQVILYVVALVTYYIVWKILLYITGTPISDNQGLSSAGQIGLSTVIGGLKASVANVIGYYLQWNVLKNGWTVYSLLSLVLIAVITIAILVAIVKTRLWKDRGRFVLLVLGVMAIFPFASIWEFVSDGVQYRPMMLQSLVLLSVLAVVLLERYANITVKNTVALLCCVVVLHNSIMANTAYYYMNLSYEHSFAEASEMMVRIHELEGIAAAEEIVVVGNRLEDVQWEFTDSQTGKKTKEAEVHSLISGLETSLLYDHDHTISYLQTVLGMELKSADGEVQKQYGEKEIVRQMPVWPEKGSVAIVDDIVVIKLADDE